MTTSQVLMLLFGLAGGIGWGQAVHFKRKAKLWEEHALGLRSELNKWISGNRYHAPPGPTRSGCAVRAAMQDYDASYYEHNGQLQQGMRGGLERDE